MSGLLTRLTRILPGSSTDKAFVNEIGKKLLKIGSANLLRHIEFVEQGAFQVIERSRALQLAPNARGDRVESVKMTGMGIERDQLVADIGRQEIDGPVVKRLNHKAS